MAEPLPSDMTVDAFLAWAVDRPGRYELELGRVIAMAPESLGHVRSKTGIQNVLSAAIHRSGSSCEAVGDGATVRIDANTAYEPDALVYCGPRLPRTAIEIPDPVIVVEVSSPSSGRRDEHEKLIGYFIKPSVRHYLIVYPERRIVVHHARAGEAITTRILSSGRIDLDPPGLECGVEELFGGTAEA